MKRLVTVMVLMTLACSRTQRQPEVIARTVLLPQTDGQRCEDLPPHLVETISEGDYAFLLHPDDLRSPSPATIELLSGSSTKRLVLWSEVSARRSNDYYYEDYFGVMVPASFLTDQQRYRFTLTTLAGKHIGEFAFQIADADTIKSIRGTPLPPSPCD
jgi:hypothetical protein